jgi:hypothetical protein
LRDDATFALQHQHIEIRIYRTHHGVDSLRVAVSQLDHLHQTNEQSKNNHVKHTILASEPNHNFLVAGERLLAEQAPVAFVEST